MPGSSDWTAEIKKAPVSRRHRCLVVQSLNTLLLEVQEAASSKVHY
jgi:hypothetical protein